MQTNQSKLDLGMYLDKMFNKMSCISALMFQFSTMYDILAM